MAFLADKQIAKLCELPKFVIVRTITVNKEHIEEIAFLIGNKKAEKFKLLIDKIELK